MATEVRNLGKAQRVGGCREPGNLPGFLLGEPFEGEGASGIAVVLDPNLKRLGFFSVSCL
jgi:hypothetical protein